MPVGIRGNNLASSGSFNMVTMLLTRVRLQQSNRKKNKTGHHATPNSKVNIGLAPCFCKAQGKKVSFHCEIFPKALKCLRYSQFGLSVTPQSGILAAESCSDPYGHTITLRGWLIQVCFAFIPQSFTQNYSCVRTALAHPNVDSERGPSKLVSNKVSAHVMPGNRKDHSHKKGGSA